MFGAVFLVFLGLGFCSKGSSQSVLGRPRLYGPSEVLVKSVIEFQCEVLTRPDEEILLEIVHKGSGKVLGMYTLLDEEETIGDITTVSKVSHDGELQCVASGQNNTDITPTVSDTHRLKVVVPVKGAKIVHSGPLEFYEGNALELRCKLSAGNYESYLWLLNDRPISRSYDRHIEGAHLRINKTTSKDSGSYMCMATNIFNKTDFFVSNSSEVVITVKVRPVLGRPQLYGPSEVLVESVIEFQCEVLTRPDEEILLEIVHKGSGKVLGMYTLLDKEETVGNITMWSSVSHHGELQCVASGQNNTDITPTVSDTHRLKVVVPVKGAKIVRSGPLEFYEGNALELRCKLSAGNYESYLWLLNGRPISRSYDRHIEGAHLRINKTTSKDSGSYMCMATNIFNKTDFFVSNSSEVVITVKDYVSDPDVSYSVLKDDSQSYFAMVTCQSTKGTPPITFTLYSKAELVASKTTEENYATFKVPVVLGQQQSVQCQAVNEGETQQSPFLRLYVEPVGGPVVMHYDYDTGENYAIVGMRFYCKAEKGSHPRYQWFLNRTLLEERGSFYYVHHQAPERSILLLAVGRSSAGTYHCEVSNSFDNTTTIRSNRRYIDKEVLNRLPFFVVLIVFGCFTFLILLVSVCCYIGVVFRRRQYGDKSLMMLEMERCIPAYEGELDLSVFSEDPGVVETARADEFDQASEASVDEWPEIEREKKTLEDEPVKVAMRMFAL